MGLKSFIQILMQNLTCLENKIQTGSKFTQSELNEILKTAKHENVRFLLNLSQINKLSTFEISFLLSSTELDEGKIETIKKAVELYDENEFEQVGQTFSDFIFRVGANIEMLNCSNLEAFKELVQCKNEVYDFTHILKNPQKHKKQKREKLAYAFEKVIIK